MNARESADVALKKYFEKNTHEIQNNKINFFKKILFYFKSYFYLYLLLFYF